MISPKTISNQSQTGNLQTEEPNKTDTSLFEENLTNSDVEMLNTNTTNNPDSNYLIYWDGNDFSASSVYYDGTKYGIGTTTPSETLHLNNGRLRAKAMIFDENAETLPHQITYNNQRFYGTDPTGTARTFMYRDFTDYQALWESFTTVSGAFRQRCWTASANTLA